MTAGWNSSVSGSPKPIQPVALTATLNTSWYTAPIASGNIQAGFATAELKGLSITNTNGATGAAVNVNVYIVPSGGTAGTANAYLFGTPIVGGGSLVMQSLTEVLAAGDTIQVSASATGLTIRGAVVEVQ